MSSLTRLLTLLALLYASINFTTFWEVNIFSDGVCGGLAPNGAVSGPSPGITCIPIGGNSYMINDDNNCLFISWSGNNCRGSSSAAVDDSCSNYVPFGSIEVVCPAPTPTISPTPWKN